MDQYFTKKNLMIGGAVLVVVIIIIVVVKMKKEKFVVNGSGVVASSGTAATPMAPMTYLTADASGNLSTSADGSFGNISATGGVYLNGYAGNVGDVIVSNGPSTPPVWAPPLTGKMATGSEGYQIFPGGFTIQWGTWKSTQTTPQPFPIPFPTACLSITATPNYCPSSLIYIDTTKTTKTEFMIRSTTISVTCDTPLDANWMAFGY